MNKRYSIADSDCKVKIGKFYENAARISGYSVTDKTKFDCRKIWVMFGPKANLESDEPIFEIEDGFATER